jgi:hypothetical protein
LPLTKHGVFLKRDYLDGMGEVDTLHVSHGALVAKAGALVELLGDLLSS